MVLDTAAPRRAPVPIEHIACESSNWRPFATASRCWPANRASESEWPNWWPALVCWNLKSEKRRQASPSSSRRNSGVLDPGWLTGKLEVLHEHLKLFHRQNPLQAGASKEELRSRFLADAPHWLLDALLARSNTLKADAQTIRLSSHRVTLQNDDEEATAKMEDAFLSGGLATPAVGEVIAKSGLDPTRARTLLQLMLRDKRLVRVSADLVLHASAYGRSTVCWRRKRACASQSRNLRIGPAFPASTPFLCWNTWIANGHTA